MIPGRRPRPLVLFSLLALVGCSRTGDRLVVAAASDLVQALPELAAAFRAETGLEVAPTFGASKLLAKQIAEGAPFDVFFSANTEFVDTLIAEHHCEASSRAVYGQGHLAVWVRDGAPPTDVAALAGDAYTRIAIANPETAPYGAAAKQALEQSGAWSRVEARIVFGDNVRQALQFAESGNASVAIVARSLVIGGPGAWTPVDASLHAPLTQALVVCGRGDRAGRPSAEAFARFVMGPEGQAILSRWGLGAGAP